MISANDKPLLQVNLTTLLESLSASREVLACLTIVPTFHLLALPIMHSQVLVAMAASATSCKVDGSTGDNKKISIEAPVDLIKLIRAGITFVLLKNSELPFGSSLGSSRK